MHREDGGEQTVTAGKQAALPPGYHVLVTEGMQQTLIVAPARCRRPERRAWGVSTQLYAARSRASWGIGDLSDLATLRTAAQRHGAEFVLVNPMNAAARVDAQEASPTRR